AEVARLPGDQGRQVDPEARAFAGGEAELDLGHEVVADPPQDEVRRERLVVELRDRLRDLQLPFLRRAVAHPGGGRFEEEVPRRIEGAVVAELDVPLTDRAEAEVRPRIHRLA